MTDTETIARFIFLRAQGWSFNQIATELNVSKPTLIKWSRQHQFDIQNLRATETEALAERIFGQRHQRWEVLAQHLKQIEQEIAKRDLEEIPASRLHGIAAQLRAEIQRETASLRFAESTNNIPSEEFIYDTHKWQA
jgi:transposase